MVDAGIMTQSKEPRSTQQREDRAPNECDHQTLVKVELEISDVDKDVQIYVCTSCGKSFTVNAW